MLHTKYNIKALGLAVSEEMLFKAIVDDARRTLANGNSSPWAYGSGELKSRRITSPTGIGSPFNSEQLVWVSSKYLL